MVDDKRLEEALNKGFLEDKTYYLKLIPRPGAMITDPKHMGYCGFDGAITILTLYKDEDTRKNVSPFKSLDEKRFFEEYFGEDLNVDKDDNPYWKNFKIMITKSPELIELGQAFNCKDPKDALAVKVLKTYKNLVADGWEKRLNNPRYKYVLVPEDYEEQKATTKLDVQKKIWTYFGSIENSPTKMRDFLSIYYNTKHKVVEVPEDSTKEFLINEINKIIEEDQATYLSLVDDKEYNIKVFIIKAMDKGLIEKRGAGLYLIQGNDTEYNFKELVNTLLEYEDRQDPLFLKMKAQIKSK